MWPIPAAAAFVLALVFHLAGGHVNRHFTGTGLAGFICLSLALAWPAIPGRKQQ